MSLPSSYQQYIHLSRYARFSYENNRRETWEETVDRYFDFFQDHIEEELDFKLTKTHIDPIKGCCS